jgi:hypothetical protein
MATYKVIQDIEAEDKLIGPLTLKQFIFAGMSAGVGFIAYLVVSKTTIYAGIPFLPFIIIPAVLAFPFSKDQPTDMWLAYRLRFYIKPRKRIWDQNGLKELVTITVPKKIQTVFTKNYSEQEVTSRLKALADTLDSRGWAVKNVDINLYANPAYSLEEGDRLIDYTSLPQTVNDTDISASDDIMDYQSNATAQHLDEMVNTASQQQREVAIGKMKQALQRTVKQTGSKNKEDQPAQQTEESFDATQEQWVNNIDEQLAETTFLEHMKKERKQNEMSRPHHKNLKTPEQLKTEEEARQKLEQAQAVTPLNNPDIVKLSTEDDIKVSSVAHIANRITAKKDKEVVVKLR